MVEGNTGYGATGRAVAGLRGVKELTHAYTSNTWTGEGCAPFRLVVRRDRIGKCPYVLRQG